MTNDDRDTPRSNVRCIESAVSQAARWELEHVRWEQENELFERLEYEFVRAYPQYSEAKRVHRCFSSAEEMNDWHRGFEAAVQKFFRGLVHGYNVLD